jgi:flavin-dependent dehydrogenase
MADSAFDIIVIGGGPAGSMAALTLAQEGYSVCLLERRTFPRETLCGEFLSHEVVSIIRNFGLENEFLRLGPTPITKFALCPESGPIVSKPLGFTAYGLKRGAFDSLLLNAAKRKGVQVLQPAEAEEVVRHGDVFEVRYRLNDATRTLHSNWCIGAYGKTSPLDKQLRRPFAGVRSNLNGIKFHVSSSALTGMNPDEIRIFAGPEMYCGVNCVNDRVATICFLEHRRGGDASPRTRLRELAAANRHFAGMVGREVLSAIDDAPIYGTGNIYFGARNVVEDGMFMVGDAARVISPLAGDGIGMALQSAQLLGTLFRERSRLGTDRRALEEMYRRQWEKSFNARLRAAAALQNILLSTPLRRFGTAFLLRSPSLLRIAISWTRGPLSSH